MDVGEFKVTVTRCVRCGAVHEDLEFKLIDNRPHDFTHFAMCPKTQQPIILEVFEQ
jgi:hypothetical protein